MRLLDNARALVSALEFEQPVRNKLTSVRLVHETDEQTFERILRLATERLCFRCRGYRKMASGITCWSCNGEGAFPVAKPSE